MKAKKPSNSEMARRIAIVSDLLARKYRRSEIYEYIRNETDWQVSHNTMYMYVNRAKGEIAKSIQRDAWQNLAESMMDLRHLYKKALEAEDLKTALAIRKEMNEVLNVSMENVQPRDVTNSEGEIGSELDSMIQDVSPIKKKKAN